MRELFVLWFFPLRSRSSSKGFVLRIIVPTSVFSSITSDGGKDRNVGSNSFTGVTLMSRETLTDNGGVPPSFERIFN